MQRVIRILRVLLPIAFIGFIALIVVTWNRPKQRGQKAINELVTSTIRPVDKPQLESRTFEDTQTIAGKVVSHIKAERAVAFTSGWNTLENVQLTIYRPSGLTYELVCPQAQFNSRTKEADAKGGVKLTSSDGVEVATAEIHFDGTHLTNHIPVQFKVDRWTGSGGALDMDVQAETLRLFEKLDATMQPGHPGEAPMRLRASEALFRRKENLVDFLKNVVLTRQADRTTGDHMLGRFSPDRKSLTGLEGQGNIVMSLSENSAVNGTAIGGEDLGGRKEVTCDRFFSEVGADGQIGAINCVMNSPAAMAHALIEGPPRRDLTAKTFRVGLAGHAVNEMRAETQVLMKETGEIPRELSGDHLLVSFDAATHRASSALVDGNFHYKDPKNEGHAMRANYDIANDHVVLTAQTGFDPTVVTDGQTIKAKMIEFSPKAGTAHAQGEVIAQLVSKPGAGASADNTSVFPAGKPVFVNSDSATMQQATKTAVFSGNVRAWQETNTIFSQELQVQGAGDQLTARGNVRTVLYNTSSTDVRKTPVLSRSDQLFAHKADRRIDLLGDVKIDDDQRHITAEKSSFFLDANRKIEHVESETKVVIIDQLNNRKGTGDKATYLVAKRMVYVSGSPATVTAPTGNVSGQQIAMDLARNKVEIMSPTSPTQGSYKQ